MTSTRASGALLSVGQAAERLGVAPSTLRTWERRYGMSPGGRSAGGHRRYRPQDLAVLELMRELVLGGEAPSRAAELALRSSAAVRAASADEDGDDDDGDVPGDGLSAADEDGTRRTAGSLRAAADRLAVPHAPEPVRRLAAAAVALDVDQCVSLVLKALARDGVEPTWDRLMRPVLVAAGTYWARTGQGVETEHLLTASCIEALTAYRRDLPRPELRPPVVLACGPVDQHSLPLHVVAAALGERRVPARVLGPLVPAPAVLAAAQRTGSRAVFLWAQLADPRNTSAAAELGAARPALRVVLGGPGWDGACVEGCLTVAGLGEASQALAPDPLGGTRKRSSGRAG